MQHSLRFLSELRFHLAVSQARGNLEGRHLEVLGSLAAIEPLEAMLIEQCSERWSTGSSSSGGDATVLSFGYI